MTERSSNLSEPCGVAANQHVKNVFFDKLVETQMTMETSNSYDDTNVSGGEEEASASVKSSLFNDNVCQNQSESMAKQTPVNSLWQPQQNLQQNSFEVRTACDSVRLAPAPEPAVKNRIVSDPFFEHFKEQVEREKISSYGSLKMYGIDRVKKDALWKPMLRSFRNYMRN